MNVSSGKQLCKEGSDTCSTDKDLETPANGMPYKSPEEKRFVRKMNWTILPLVAFIIFIQFADKAAISVAAVLGLMEDTHISGEQFSWVASIFYLGYLVYQLPNNYLLQKVPHGRYLGVLLLMWGTVMCTTSLCHNFAELMATRFLLGLFEAGTSPCIFIILNTLYRRTEQAACFGYVAACTGMGAVIGTLLSFAISFMEGVAGLRAWRWVYIILGAITIFFGFIVFFFLADDPNHKLLRLTEVEKEIVKERTQDNAVVRSRKIKTYQMWEALKEPRLWLILLASLCINFQNGALVNFSATLVKGFNFSATESIILQIPSGLAAAFAAIIAVITARKSRQAIYTGIGMGIVSAIGCLLLAVIPQSAGAVKLLGYYLSWAMAGAYTIILTVIANNVSGYTKKIFYNGAYMIFSTFGNFIGPLMMVQTQAPGYVGGMIGYTVANVVVIICLILIRYIMAKENRRRLADPPTEPTDVYLDLTDAEDRNYIYRL
ncbi:major facilitator superfamily domain-containing protein [Radiomyces spectabilis]|uniref:major facilitator superfamily domain-containing protein n=1 Tax=Radiomyces spectabilis TaxID=64574 RepID=UPI0022212588|nr:major facilitator superfamily domain-containing protein [Radiomyces spectabilis]KAI8391208.1 major facilitator superfamily domain-containing protein [Radiomyces spectabilis]